MPGWIRGNAFLPQMKRRMHTDEIQLIWICGFGGSTAVGSKQETNLDLILSVDICLFICGKNAVL
jgi:hypothetical protein